MKKFRCAAILTMLIMILLFSACGLDYTEDFLAMNARFNEMDAEWTALMEEEAVMNAATPSFDAIDDFYDRATQQANSDMAELGEMIRTLKTYQKGINEKDYEEFMEILNDSYNTTEIALDYFAYDRGWTKAKSINDDNSALAEEWNNLKNADKTAAVAQGYKTRMLELKEKLISIQEEIDIETYDEMMGNLDDAIDAFDEWVTRLEAEEAGNNE